MRVHRKLPYLLVAGITAGSLLSPWALERAGAAGTQLSYIVMPHPDDEWQGWSLISGSTANNKVFIYVTSGEETSACNRTTDGQGAGGPWWYQGPGSPVAQPNYGEALPVNPPWGPSGGKHSAACADSRKGATRQFLIDRAASDPTLPNFATTPTTKCFTGNTRAGIPPRRKDFGDPTGYLSNCATVYSSLNHYGTLIFFDLGDNDATPEEVEWAILAVKNNKAYVGVQNLPDFNAIGGYRNVVNYGTACAVYNHPDHHAVHTALWNWSMGIPYRWGRTCTNDPDSSTANGGRLNNVSLAEQSNNFLMSGNTRVGPFQTRYGWLRPTFWGSDMTGYDKVFGRTQAFWGR